MFKTILGRIPVRAVASLPVVGVVGAIALYAVFVEPVEAAKDANVVQECRDAWDDAPASTYCTSSGIYRAVTGSGLGNCIIEVSSCSITANVGTDSQTWTPSWPSSYGTSGDGVDVDDVDAIDICFADTTGGYTASVKTSCATGETGSDSATTNGLTASSS